MAQPCPSNKVFNVIRNEPELVSPARPTPHELKPLSDIDNQKSFRYQVPSIFFYAHNPSMEGKDPAQLVKRALSETLVFYYPLAGRLREGPDQKLMVDCNEEGVIFIEADADATLEQFGQPIQPPFPCLEEMLYDVPGSEGITNCPLLLFQVTRLKCGGFIVGVRLNHAMSDAPGFIQFMKAIAEIAQGASEPSIAPVWCRELLYARNPPRITHTHLEYEEVPLLLDDPKKTRPKDITMTHHSFFFGPNDIKVIHQMFPHDQHNTTFEVLTAFLWCCRTKALQFDPDEEVRFTCVANARIGDKSKTTIVPLGYYGNAFMLPTVTTTAKKLCENYGYALEMVKKAKGEANNEYLQSVADLMVIRGYPYFTSTWATFFVSGLKRVGFREVDFGWGKAVSGVPARAGFGLYPEITFFLDGMNAEGEEGIMVPINLPSSSMKMFVQELEKVLGNNNCYGC